MKNFTSKQLIPVFHHTRFLSTSKYAEDTDTTIALTTVYDSPMPVKPAVDGIPVEFVCGGTASTGYKLSDSGLTAILNFADGKKPGGWPEHGCQTQEENLCRCTNLYETLLADVCSKHYYQENKRFDRKNVNGLSTDNVIYSPDVLIIKDDQTYEEITPKQVDVITCPAPNCNFTSPEAAIATYTRRIENFLLTAVQNGAENLVLGAWGCGAFCQNPNWIGQAFVTALNKYSGYFKRVVFAFRPTPNWGVRDSSYIAFLQEFSKHYLWGVQETEV